MHAPKPLPFELPPTQDELPYDDGEPMETPKHREQMNLLIESLRGHPPSPDAFIGGNMALYYSVLQARNQDFRAPDFFVVLGADPARERKSWVVWEEDGRTPDVVIELLSDSTEREDRGRKRQVYEGLRVGQYYLFDPISCDLSGFTLEERTLVPLRAGDDGGLDCPRLGLRLLVREGTFQGRTTRWLRWVTPDGRVLPTGEERAREHAARAEQEAARAEQEAARAEQEAARAEQEAARANAAEAKAAALAARLRALGIEP